MTVEREVLRLESEMAKIASKIYSLHDKRVTSLFWNKWHDKRLEKLKEKQGALFDKQILTWGELSEARLNAIKHYIQNQGDLYDAAIVDAYNNGVRIDVDAGVISRARWRNEHLAKDDSNFAPIKKYNLELITEEQLDANARSYLDKFDGDIPPEEIEKARGVILQIPLTHFMNGDIQGIRNDTETLHSYRSLTSNNIRTKGYYDKENDGVSTLTYETDIAMGLDNFVFMCLGAPYPNEMKGVKSRIILINSSLLLQEGCLVTPTDIAEFGDELNDNGGISSDKALDQAEEYFKSVVRGSDWVEILARRLAYWRRDNQDKPFEIESCFELGEIKYKGLITADMITGVIKSEKDLEEYKKRLRTLPIDWPDKLFATLNVD